MAQLPGSDNQLGMIACPSQPRFRVDGEDVPDSVNTVMSELGPDVVVPVAAGGGGPMNQAAYLPLAQPEPRTLHISPIPFQFRRQRQLLVQIEEKFGEGTVQECKLPRSHKGFGFVTFNLTDTYETALASKVFFLRHREETHIVIFKPARRG